MKNTTIQVVTMVNRKKNVRWRDRVSVRMAETLEECSTLFGLTEEQIIQHVNYVRVLAVRNEVRQARKKAGNGPIIVRLF